MLIEKVVHMCICIIGRTILEYMHNVMICNGNLRTNSFECNSTHVLRVALSLNMLEIEGVKKVGFQ